MTIRLLYLTRESHPSFRPDIAELFGQSLRQQGVFSDLVALQEGAPTPWAAGRAHVRSGHSRLGRIIARLRLALDLASLTAGKHYSAIQVRDRIVGALIALGVARWRGLPFFYWLSLPFPEAWEDIGSRQDNTSAKTITRLFWRIRGRLSGWLLYRVVLPRATHIFVQSDAMRDMLETRGLPRSRMTPVPMGVSMPTAIEAIEPATDTRLAGKRVLVYLGALERIRHPEIMLEAMCLVINEAPDTVLALVGDSQTPGERAWLENEISRLGLAQHAFITGWLPPEQARRYLRTACIGLSPVPRSRVLDVGSPTKVCEYLAYGIPVVANDQPDQDFLLRETGGGVCVPLTPAGFASGILRLLADPERARHMADTGRREIARLRSYEVIGKELATSYRTLLGEQQPS